MLAPWALTTIQPQHHVSVFELHQLRGNCQHSTYQDKRGPVNQGV